MKQDLFAPPKLAVRTYAKLVGAFSIVAVLVGVGMAALGVLSIGALLVRTVVVAAVTVAAVWLYSKLLEVARRVRPERMPWIHAVMFVTGFGLFFGAFGVMLRGAPGIGVAMSGVWWQFPFMFGWMLAIGGWGRRVGESMHCPHCEYEFKFDHEENAPIRCPECGKGWLGLLKKGRRVRSGRLIAGGIALAFTATVVMQPIFYMRFLAPHLPTPLLFASLYATPKSVYTAWDELAQRPLDSKWTRVMAERVLRQRGRDQYDDSGRWFEAMDAAGRIPAELRERFYRESFAAELDVPRRVRAGEAFTAHVRVKHLASSKGTMGLMFGGYFVGVDPAPIGRMDKTLWGYELRPGVFSLRQDVLEQALRAEHPGEVRVRAVYWVVYQPSFTESLVWKADGTPRMPVGAMWFERVEVEKVVRVE